MIRTLLFSTLYPNRVRPGLGIFVETRLRELLRSGEVQSRVLAPVPWFPFRHPMFGEYAAFAQVPRSEERNGIAIEHPRYFVPPRVGMNVAPYTLAHVGLAAARRLIAEGYDFDLIDAHYAYADGVAAVAIGKALRKPVIVTARGSDINVLAQHARPRKRIVEALQQCDRVVAVSGALREAIAALGVARERIVVLRNGVDLALFRPEPRDAARASAGVSGFVIASVGNLIPGKGHHLVIEALRALPDAQALIVGRGAEEARLKSLAECLGVASRVRFVGAVPHDRLRTLYCAADCLVLASEREGWPNVLLEAMACGTPVVASNVGGIPEIVGGGSVGVLMDALSADGVSGAIGRLRALAPERAAVRAYAERFSWDDTTAGQLGIFKAALTGGHRSDARRAMRSAAAAPSP